MSDKPKVIRLTQTCSACPSQWEGKLGDGRMVYIRYRWGYLEASASPKPTDDVMEAVMADDLYGKQLGDEFDGSLSTSDMKRALADALDFDGAALGREDGPIFLIGL